MGPLFADFVKYEASGKKKKPTKEWGEDAITDALIRCKSGMSVRKAATLCKVPRTTSWGGGGRFARLSHNFKIEVSYFKYIKPME